VIKKAGLNKNDYEDQNKSVKVGLSVKSDIVIIGKYSIVGDQIQITTLAIDILNNRSIDISVIKGQVGPGIFDLVENASSEMSKKMSDEFPPVEQKILEELADSKDDKIILIKDEKIGTDKDVPPKKNYFSPQNIAGISLISTGTSFVLAGSGLLIYDFIGYMPGYLKLKENASSSNQYEEYVRSYNTFIGLMGAGIGVIIFGITLDTIGIPLIIYKEKTKKLAIILEPKMNFSIALSYSF
jgi:hypothetical protein